MLASKFFVNFSSKNNLIKFLSLLKNATGLQEKQHDYNIEFVKAHDVQPTLNFLEENFFREEPLSKSLNITKRSFQGPIDVYIQDAIREGMTLIARKNGEIIGASLNVRNCKFDAKKFQGLAKCSDSLNTRKLFQIWSLLASQANIHDELNELCLFEVKMLAVKKEHHNKGIGKVLTQKSLELARDLNFSHALISCTNEYAQRIVESLEMKRIWDVPYRNILLNDAKTPAVVPEHPHTTASVSFIDLKA